MVARENRLSEFITGSSPDSGLDVEVLCSDHVGTYVAPFPCRYDGAKWRNTESGEPLETLVVGWREWKRPDRR